MSEMRKFFEETLLPIFAPMDAPIRRREMEREREVEAINSLENQAKLDAIVREAWEKTRQRHGLGTFDEERAAPAGPRDRTI